MQLIFFIFWGKTPQRICCMRSADGSQIGIKATFPLPVPTLRRWSKTFNPISSVDKSLARVMAMQTKPFYKYRSSVRVTLLWENTNFSGGPKNNLRNNQAMFLAFFRIKPFNLSWFIYRLNKNFKRVSPMAFKVRIKAFMTHHILFPQLVVFLRKTSILLRKLFWAIT